MDEQLIALYHRHVAAAFDRQLRMGEYLERKVPGEEWEYDTETARLTFGKLKFEAPFVGTHADHNNSWLWAWSNKHVKLTVTNRALGDTVRVLVHRLGVHALAAPGFSLEPLLGPELVENAAHVLGMFLARELGFNAYHLTPNNGGRGLVLIRDKRLEFKERRPLVRIMTIFPQVIDAMTVFDHKQAFMHYAQDYGLTATEDSNAVTVTSGADTITASFDDRGRFTTLEGTVAPVNSKPAKQATKSKPAKKAAKKPQVSAKRVVKKKSAVKRVVKQPGKKR